MPLFCCPVCKRPLFTGGINGKSLLCKGGHCYDISGSGYVNLLLSNQMHTKHPGDNKQMVTGRTAFLSKGYYNKLKDEICIQTVECLKGRTSFNLLDAGCGEGYYTAAVSDALNKVDCDKGQISICGVDISKEAVKAASKRRAAALFAVASVFSLPVANQSLDMVMVIFAPFVREEYYRALKKGGILLLVIPNESHLWELKQAVYDKPYKNEPKPPELEGFSLIKQTAVGDELFLDNPSDIQSLFAMTPYVYKTSVEDTARLKTLKSLKTQADFLILLYRRI